MKFPDYNWKEIWTIAEAEKQLKNFSFKGVGWYITSGYESMLVTKTDVKNCYWFHHYYYDPRNDFSAIGSLPAFSEELGKR